MTVHPRAIAATLNIALDLAYFDPWQRAGLYASALIRDHSAKGCGFQKWTGKNVCNDEYVFLGLSYAAPRENAATKQALNQLKTLTQDCRQCRTGSGFDPHFDAVLPSGAALRLPWR